MLNLGRKPGECITLIGRDGKVIAQIFVNSLGEKSVQLAIDADKEAVRIWRGPPPIDCSTSHASLECQQPSE